MSEIIGIGTDLCSVARMERAMEKDHFYTRVFLPGERDYLERAGKGKAQSAAAMFAAKEAVAKALGTGFAHGVAAWLIEITHDAYGAPGVILHDTAAQRLAALGGARVLLSLSHEGDMAQAFAVAVGA